MENPFKPNIPRGLAENQPDVSPGECLSRAVERLGNINTLPALALLSVLATATDVDAQTNGNQEDPNGFSYSNIYEDTNNAYAESIGNFNPPIPRGSAPGSPFRKV